MGMLAHSGERLREGQPSLGCGRRERFRGLPAIVGWGTAVPDRRVTNADLEARSTPATTWIVERTGIHERRVAAEGETTASLGTAAAADAIKRAGLTPADIDLMIVATATPEQPMPHTGAFVGEALGLHCGSFDLSAACAGFVYELVVGASMLNAGYEHVLIVGSETLSRIVDPDDRATAILFGDGAGAAVLAHDRRSRAARVGSRLRRIGGGTARDPGRRVAASHIAPDR